MRPEIRNLAFHPGIAILALDMGAHRGHQIAHRPDAPVKRPEAEPKLIGGRHCSGVYSTAGCRMLTTECYCRKRPITYSTSESTTLIKIDVASGK